VNIAYRSTQHRKQKANLADTVSNALDACGAYVNENKPSFR